MAKKKPTDETPNVHKEIRGFNIYINEFGEIKTNQSIDELNTFLNKYVDDKKLTDYLPPISHTDVHTDSTPDDDMLEEDLLAGEDTRF